MRPALCRILFLTAFCGCLVASDSIPPIATTPLAYMEEEALPVSAHSASPRFDAELETLRRYRLSYGCKVPLLSELDSAEALAFEKNSEAPIDTADLAPPAGEALNSFRETVLSLGGTFDLKSAYRPPAYQAHLHEVWVKWVKQLRGNRSAGCRALREEVGAEFARHALLAKQQPVPESDHMIGYAFDAYVRLPRGAKFQGKRVTVDKLAAMFGFKRPTIRRDPVHFKLVADKRTVEISRLETPAL